MLAGCVPIVAEWCGPAEFVTPDCGYKVAVTDPIKMATEIARILSILDADRSLLRDKGDAASTRIRSSYNEAQFLESMNKFFVSAISGAKLPS